MHIKKLLEVKRVIFVISFFLASLSTLHAQGTIGETDIETYSYSGSVGLQSHAYTTTQDVNRRQPLGALLTANIDFSVLGFQSGADIRYSTDNNEFRQSLNRFNFFGSWKWVTLSAGDVNPGYGNYALGGSTIRGGELNLSPGIVFIDLAAGRVNRAVYDFSADRARRPTFERWLYAFQAGVGETQQSHFSLSAFYSKDNRESIPDTSNITNYQPGVLSPPAENLAVTPKFQVSVFEESFKVGAETTVSAFTRDQRSPDLAADESDIPSFLTNLFTPRSSTRLSYAGMAHTEFSFDVFQMRTQYERIMPGYKSLGMRDMRDDQHTLTLTPAFQFFDQKWSLDGEFSLSEDNLLGNRISTQTRQNINLNTTVQVSESVNLGGGYTRFESSTSSNDSGNQGQHRQLSQVFQFFPSFSIINGSTTHNFSLTGIYQDMLVEYPVQDGGLSTDESNTKTGAASYSLALPSGLSVNSSVNVVFGEAPANTFTTLTGSLGAGYALFQRKLNLNLTMNVSQNTFEQMVGAQSMTNKTMQLNGNFVASYSVTSSTNLQLNIRTQNNTVMEGDGRAFSEMEARLRFQQRF
ncbi:MAG: hypothetical protein GVY07_03750 [Bacteroidetes bacterium]|jgi:hypothetical protein|nr:hypothetical protein [Bacteroidota bacterium]